MPEKMLAMTVFIWSGRGLSSLLLGLLCLVMMIDQASTASSVLCAYLVSFVDS